MDRMKEYMIEKRYEVGRWLKEEAHEKFSGQVGPSKVGWEPKSRHEKILYIPKDNLGEVKGTKKNKPSLMNDDASSITPLWRIKERMKTVSVNIVMCLNIGVDPPDIVKINPCAKMECWIDPFSGPPTKALENVGKTLQSQYERWQPRARYKACLDPTVDEVKKVCVSSRKNAKDERVLFHYNGHGVPKPTVNGEIWVFNKNFTQYIPLSIYDLQSWMDSPSIYVYDCSAAGKIVHSFNQFSEQREKEIERLDGNVDMSVEFPLVAIRDCIQLAACQAHEILPMNSDLPADLFTACLTTPIEIALRCFLLHNSSIPNVTIGMIEKIPGRPNDRRTPLGEMNWIFTAITDTIAWNMLPKELFQKLFRQDLLVASLFRNYLLAERIMQMYGCTPISQPELPEMYQNSLWDAWDLAVDLCLRQLSSTIDEPSSYRFSDFFAEQLTAFEVWLDHVHMEKSPPEQLPIVLQVLLSQVHRLRALQLLARFLDIGAEGVRLSLAVGIFPYVLKLLQSPAVELREVLIFIWGKILAVDPDCQSDLVKDNGHKYFIHVLNAPNVTSHQRATAAFVISVICDGYRLGQMACLKSGVLTSCYAQLLDSEPLLKRWSCLCMGKLWENYVDAKRQAVKDGAQDKLAALVNDETPEVRAAAVYALGTFLGNREQTATVIGAENGIALALMRLIHDPDPIVRREVVIALSIFAKTYEAKFKTIALELWEEERERNLLEKSNAPARLRTPSLFADQLSTISEKTKIGPLNSLYICIWRSLLIFTVDPQPEVAEAASLFIDSINKTFLQPDANNLSIATSSLFSWSCRYFAEPSKKIYNNNDISPLQNDEIQMRLERYEIALQRSHSLESIDDGKRISSQKLTIKHSQHPISSIIFHPFESTIAIADEKGIISLYETGKASKFKSFSNRNSANIRLTSMVMINPLHNNLLVTSTDEGIIKVWRGFHDQQRNDQISSWRMFKPSLLLSANSNNFFLDWNATNGILSCPLPQRQIRIWDLEKQMMIQDLNSNSESPIVALTSDRAHGNVYIAGFKDGSIRFFDRRLVGNDSCIAIFSEHKAPITGLHTQENGDHRLVSGSIDGEICLWDASYPACLNSFSTHSGRMSCLMIHPSLALIAASGQDHTVKIFHVRGDLITSIKHYEGFFGERISPTSLFSFHPSDTLLAVGTVDSLVPIYSL